MFKSLLSVFVLALTLAACGAQGETFQASEKVTCVAGPVEDLGDQSVCTSAATVSVECAAPAAPEQMAQYGDCAPGLAHSNTYCCAPKAKAQ